jgi:hypothetical protein
MYKRIQFRDSTQRPSECKVDTNYNRCRVEIKCRVLKNFDCYRNNGTASLKQHSKLFSSAKRNEEYVFFTVFRSSLFFQTDPIDSSLFQTVIDTSFYSFPFTEI